ncbi:putative peptidyl-tRNA hydrolase PTRHD1 [Dioscorea cayenensis subsp. rotundata]|uniref:peptidyl-tRNA hydrolase n=1 Tax=Dioscorea cayennensis subsp. rotundata TaxID=55577 RepID=A0AB40BXN8_DIOCR|nr:putative peptidyl-tRNA hydrolase PTRHD1 [Dioscorea cayenensis subsp. rotundata]
MVSILPVRFPLCPCFARANVRSSFLLSRAGARVRVSRLLLARAMSADSTAAVEGGREGEGCGEEVKEEVVQYVVLRRDLVDTWPMGSVVAQGCHAAVAAVWAHRDHPDTVAYCSDANLDSMHKVTLEVKGEAQIRNLSEKLKVNGIDHKLWIEQPENIPTCIATRPYPRSQVVSFFKKLKLCK